MDNPVAFSIDGDLFALRDLVLGGENKPQAGTTHLNETSPRHEQASL